VQHAAQRAARTARPVPGPRAPRPVRRGGRGGRPRDPRSRGTAVGGHALAGLRRGAPRSLGLLAARRGLVVRPGGDGDPGGVAGAPCARRPRGGRDMRGTGRFGWLALAAGLLTALLLASVFAPEQLD